MVFQAHDDRILASTLSMTSQGPPILISGGSDCNVHFWNIDDCFRSPNSSSTSDQNLVERLRTFVSFKTVSSNPAYKTECIKGASFLRSVFRDFGAKTRLFTSQDNLNPVVFAVFEAQVTTVAKQRVLFYGHYDVIPAEDGQGKWRSDPFLMKGADEYLYGRGTSDNKGPIMAAVYAVAELSKQRKLEMDVLFLVEGEEECGSRGFESIIRANKSVIGHVDWILLANSYWLDDEVPCLTYGLRGVIHATLQVASSHPDLHSGVDGSSLMDESLKDLVMLLNSLTGKKGVVTIPGFYDKVLDLSPDEWKLYQQIATTMTQRDPKRGSPEAFANALLQKWRQATLTIHRFGTSGPENSTVIPSTAWAKVSFRLVPNQEATVIAQQLVRHLNSSFKELGTTNDLNITIDHVAEPWLGDYNNQLYKTLEEGIKSVWWSTASDKRRPFYIREGGSIPAIRFLEKEFGAPAAHLPCGQASDSAHLDNERLRLLNLYKSRDVFKWVFKELPRKAD
jgi:di- and tripeptidase